MKKIAVVGGGIAGLSVANVLSNRYDVTVFEKEPSPGGLVRCKTVNGSLFHICGGHVFNTKNPQVNDWFWSRFKKDEDFIMAVRKAAVCFETGFVDYPIENHVYQLGPKVLSSFYAEVEEIKGCTQDTYGSFGDFLRKQFGKTLYDLYFGPYNKKIWRCNLDEVPMSWMEGKLPMPSPDEMIAANRKKVVEDHFVHSSFYYAKRNGSQFIADTLAKGLNVRYNTPVYSIAFHVVNGEYFDKVVFCGSVKDLPKILTGVDLGGYCDEIAELRSHGTTAVFCEIEPTPYSWIYQPSIHHDSHRIICTGNFSPMNNALGKMTCTVEFTDWIDVEEITRQLAVMPYRPQYITHHYSKYSYPIQSNGTRAMISKLKELLSRYDIALCGRFAEWEYYNMDASMASAINLSISI